MTSSTFLLRCSKLMFIAACFWFPCWEGVSDVCALAFARSSQLKCPGARVRNAVKAIALMRSSSEVRRMWTAPRFLFVRQIRKMNPPCRSLFGVIFVFQHSMKSSLFWDLLFNFKEFVFQMVVASHLSEMLS